MSKHADLNIDDVPLLMIFIQFGGRSMVHSLRLYFCYVPKWFFIISIVFSVGSFAASVYGAVLIPASIAMYFAGEIQIGFLVLSVGIVMIINIGIKVLQVLMSSFGYTKYYIRLSKGINMTLFTKMQQLPMQYYDDNKFLEKYGLAMDFTEEAVKSIANWILEIVGVISSITTTTVIIALVNSRMLAVMLVCLVVGAIIDVISQIVVFSTQKRLAKTENIGNYVERVFYLEKYAIELRTSKVSRVIFSLFEKNMNIIQMEVKKLMSKGLPLDCLRVTISDVVMYFVILVYACYSIASLHVFSVGDLVKLVSGSFILFTYLSLFIGCFTKLFDYLNHFKFYQDIISIKPEEINVADCMEIQLKKDITLDNISFFYNDKCVLDEMSLKISKGEFIAVVGPNGAGKSTLLKVLMCYYEMNQGNICLDDVDISQYSQRAYRKLFAFINQNPILFEMTIAENILCRKCESEEDRIIVEHALVKVGLWEKVRTIQNTIDCVIGKEFNEGGIILSGGETQRIAIARALVMERPILVLDEPSSHIDTKTSRELFGLLRALAGERTIVVITHDTECARVADRIIWLEDGRIIEDGTHEELIQRNGNYFRAFQSRYNILVED